MEYTFYILILSNLRLPGKTEGSLNLLYRIYIFYYSEVLSNLRLCSVRFSPQHETFCDYEISTKEDADY